MGRVFLWLFNSKREVTTGGWKSYVSTASWFVHIPQPYLLIHHSRMTNRNISVFLCENPPQTDLKSRRSTAKLAGHLLINTVLPNCFRSTDISHIKNIQCNDFFFSVNFQQKDESNFADPLARPREPLGFGLSPCRNHRLTSGRWPTWRTILLYNTFISVLYMFRANACSSSGGQFY